MTQVGPRILVVEDEEKTATTIAMYLRRAGYAPQVIRDGAQALDAVKHASDFALIILDIMLPGVRGEEICSAVRQYSDIPIIMLTALATEEQRVSGLELGADDYVSKPFSPRELVARVRARLRNRPQNDAGLLKFGRLEINPASRVVQKADQVVELTSLEFDLLVFMARQPDRVWSREQLIEHVLGDASARTDRAVDAHIKNLRRKIETDRRNPEFIQTVFGVGYRFGLPPGSSS